MLVPYSAASMFELVDRVESYPAFLPWCGGATILETHEGGKTARIRIVAVREQHDRAAVDADQRKRRRVERGSEVRSALLDVELVRDVRDLGQRGQVVRERHAQGRAARPRGS